MESVQRLHALVPSTPDLEASGADTSISIRQPPACTVHILVSNIFPDSFCVILQRRGVDGKISLPKGLISEAK